MSPDTPALLDRSFPLPIDVPFTRRDARAAGVSDKVLHHLSHVGLLRRPVKGVYVAAQVPDSLALRCRLLRLVVPPGAFVCDRTAAWLHRGDAALAPNEHLEPPPVSCFLPSDRGRLRNPLASSGERAVVARDLMEVDGLLVTTPLRTALDLGRLQRTSDMRLWGMDSMLGLGHFTIDELLAEVPRFKGERGVVGLRLLAPLIDGGSASFGESALRLRWYDAGLPRPRTQIPVEVDGEIRYWLDLGLEELLFAAEYDGAEWHTSQEQIERDLDRRAWLADERGWMVEVFRQEHVFGRQQNADARLANALRAARATLARRTVVV